MKTKFFSKNGLQHTYQRTIDKGVFLYKTSERLMLFTILSVCSRHHKIVVCALAMMFTHLHSLSKVERREDLGRFFGNALSIYVKEINSFTGRTGPMFAPIDSASKIGAKKIKEAISYVYNNSTEKKLYQQACEDRWNFLAYYNSSHPFSKKLVKRKATHKLRDSCKIVDIEFKSGRYLNLARLYSLFEGLGKDETEQLIDYIIVKYNFISYEETIRYYPDYYDMLKAFEITVGKEFDLNEDYEPNSELPYLKMLNTAQELGLLGKEMKIYKLSESEKKKYAVQFRKRFSAMERLIVKFLHVV